MEHFIIMVLIGIISGATIGWAIFSINDGVRRAMFSTGAVAVFFIEFKFYESNFTIPEGLRIWLFATFLLFAIISFLVFLINAFKILRNQETRYAIKTWEILFGKKEVFDSYYAMKEKEINQLLEDSHNLSKIEEEIEKSEQLKKFNNERENDLNKLETKIEELLKTCQCIELPISQKIPVDSRFLDYIPKFIFTISNFYHHISLFTEDFMEDIDFNKKNNLHILDSYLTALSLFVGEHLFNWNNIRIHFRKLSENNNEYIKYLAFEEKNIEYTENLTTMPNNLGIINECIKTKRSLVKSANKELHIEGSNDHKWKNYITMVFDKFQYSNKPVLTMTISVQHDVEHQEFLYFLSYIQIEQIIQTNLEAINRKMNISEVLMEQDNGL